MRICGKFEKMQQKNTGKKCQKKPVKCIPPGPPGIHFSFNMQNLLVSCKKNEAKMNL